MSDKIIFRTNCKDGSALKDLEKDVENKWQWRWLEEKDVNGDYFDAYIRKIELPGEYRLPNSDPFSYFLCAIAMLFNALINTRVKRQMPSVFKPQIITVMSHHSNCRRQRNKL